MERAVIQVRRVGAQKTEGRAQQKGRGLGTGDSEGSLKPAVQTAVPVLLAYIKYF